MFLIKVELNLNSRVDTHAYDRHQTYVGSFFLYSFVLYQSSQLKLLHEGIIKYCVIIA